MPYRVSISPSSNRYVGHQQIQHSKMFTSRKTLIPIGIIFSVIFSRMITDGSTCIQPLTPCKSTEMRTMLDTAISLSTTVRDSLHVSAEQYENQREGACSSLPMDCGDILQCGQKESGAYTVWPRSRIVKRNVQVYCDMDTDGGGWTVFQRRGDFGHARDYFYNGWLMYKEGFGDVRQDFWLGNDLLFAVTNQRSYSLRFDLKDLEGEKRYATYDHFWIDSEDYNYTLHVKGYSGDAGDAFGGHTGSQFSTKDRDNDKHETASCATAYKGAWWYARCHSSNLNGLYLNGTHTSHADGVNWSKWRGQNYSFPFAEMKIRNTLYLKSEPIGHAITPHK